MALDSAGAWGHSVWLYLTQYALLALALPSEVWYVGRSRPVGGGHTSKTMTITGALLLLFNVVGLVVSQYDIRNERGFVRLVDAIGLIVVILLQIASMLRTVDEVLLLTFWCVRFLLLWIHVGGYLGYAQIVVTLMVIVGNVHAYRRRAPAFEQSMPLEPNFIRKLCFTWFDDVNYVAHRDALNEDSLPELAEQRKCDTLLSSFDRSYGKTNAQYRMLVDTSGSLTVWKMLGAFKKDLIWTGINRFALIAFFFACPWLQRQLLQGNEELSRSESNFYAFALFAVSIAIALLNGQYLYSTVEIGLKIKSILMAKIYSKLLLQTDNAHVAFVLLTEDSRAFVNFMQNMHMVWSGVVIIVLTIVALAFVLGWSAIIGIAVMALTVSCSDRIAKKLNEQRKVFLGFKGKRVANTKETVSSIRQIKYDSLEPFCEARINRCREHELEALRKSVRYDTVKYLLSSMSPMVVSFATFLMMALIGDSASRLTVQSVFVSMSLFNLLKYPLSVIPTLFTSWKDAKMSMERISKFLTADSRHTAVTSDSNGDAVHSLQQVSQSISSILTQPSGMKNAVEIRNGVFGIGETIVLRNINLSIPKGSLVIITGGVATGKSSLLSAMLGNLRTLNGTVILNGRVSLVTQMPWTEHRSVKENVVFGETWDASRYENAIKVCCLMQDIEGFAAGEERVLTEGGQSVSGGQKQRIALARAVYRQADIYLLDDPLRSLDGKVAKLVYDGVLGRHGILRSSTRVLVTNNRDHLRDADAVVQMREGLIIGVLSVDEYNAQFPTSENPQSDEKAIDEKQERVNHNHAAKTMEEEVNTQETVPFKINWQYCKQFGLLSTALVVFLEVIYNVLDIHSMMVLAEWTASVGRLEQTMAYIVQYGIILGVMSVLLILKTQTIQHRCIAVAGQTHSEMLHTVIRQPMSFFDKTHSGKILTYFSIDLSLLDSSISNNIRQFLASFFGVVFTLGLFTYKLTFNIVIVAVIVGCICGICGLSKLLRHYLKTSRALKRLEAATNSPIILQFNETNSGLETIRAHQQQDRFFQDFLEKVDRHQKFSYCYIAANRWLTIRLEAIGAVVIYFVALATVRYQYIIGLSTMGVLISYALRLIPSLNTLINITAQLEDNVTSYERIRKILDLSSESEKLECSNGIMESRKARGCIEFIQFSLVYDDGTKVLRDVTLKIESNERIGIVGRTGAGKSSLINALYCLYPDKSTGIVKIDDRTVNDIPLATLRQSLTVIPQNTALFSGTVQENIDPLNRHQRSELQQILAECKLDTVALTDNVDQLSVGQRQLLCLARGILKRTKVVILDEATSTIDGQTEETVRSVIRTRLSNCTVLMITHRLNTLHDCDRVLWLADGEVRKFDRLENYTDDDWQELKLGK